MSDSLARLRADARLELDVLIEHRSRDGEDPWEFLQFLPTVDQLVVTALRDEELDRLGKTAEFLLARLGQKTGRSDAARLRSEADRLEYGILRDIAHRHPELTRAVWTLAGDLDHAQISPAEPASRRSEE
ncbi:hypothetical protein [Paramicrobacterium agarici]|uniref:Tryptophan synthase subunit alpha n=1 Tax=Paramicrobacterium agarici TaxID=630514 RepID=A0A2A9DU58_9MICO|nr:hypothetical protein [Microbacterium agarici]PFG29695.1 hypothetical protein ATJ78_0610 [Microbacterium agarici]TQO22726.1 hypothetical protein FB385_1565 [Microbacterium agarici]